MIHRRKAEIRTSDLTLTGRGGLSNVAFCATFGICDYSMPGGKGSRGSEADHSSVLFESEDSTVLPPRQFYSWAFWLGGQSTVLAISLPVSY